MKNLLAPGVKHDPSFVTGVGKYHKQTCGILGLTNIPINKAAWCVFARDCKWCIIANEPKSGDVHQSCQNSSLSNTLDILNILIGCLLEDEQDGEPVTVRDEEQFSDEGLNDDEWKNHHLI